MADGSFRVQVQQKIRGQKVPIYGPRRAARPDAEDDLALMRAAAEGKPSREEELEAMATEATRLKEERASDFAARRLAAKQEYQARMEQEAAQYRWEPQEDLSLIHI